MGHLSGSNQDLSILGCTQVVHDPHQLAGLSLGLLSLGHMQVHLVTIEISIVGTAHTLIEAKCPAAHIKHE